jgi:hypothetical protein
MVGFIRNPRNWEFRDIEEEEGTNVIERLVR